MKYYSEPFSDIANLLANCEDNVDLAGLLESIENVVVEAGYAVEHDA